MSNKGIGNLFEQELDKLLYEHDFWVHRLTQNARGQPADIIAVKDDQADLIDCKVCTHDTFDLARVEENQQLAMTHWNNCGNDNAWFALKTSFGVYMLSWEAVRNVMKTSRVLNMRRIAALGETIEEWLDRNGGYYGDC